MNISKTAWIGLGVAVVLGYVLWNKQKKAKEKAALTAKMTAGKESLTAANAPKMQSQDLSQPSIGKTRTV